MREDSIIRNLTSDHDHGDVPGPSQALLFMAFVSGYALREQKAEVQVQTLLIAVFGLPIVLANAFVVLNAATIAHSFYVAVFIEALAFVAACYSAWMKYLAYRAMKKNAEEMLSANSLKAAGIK